MKKGAWILFVIVMAACVPVALGYGSLVGSFNAPSTYPNGVGWANWSGACLWVNCNGNNYRYRVVPSTGSIYSSFSNPATGAMGAGAANIGGTGYVFVASYNASHIYRIGMGSGSTYSSYAAPGTYAYGVDYCSTGGNYVYYTAHSSNMLYFMDAYTGSVVRSHALSFSPNDVAWDPRGNLWIVDGNYLVRQTTTTGSLVNSFSTSAYGYPSGCAADGTYVYVGINSPLHRVLIFETSGVGIAPASLGRVKAAYR